MAQYSYGGVTQRGRLGPGSVPDFPSFRYTATIALFAMSLCLDTN